MLSCPLCAKTFKDRSKLNDHLPTHTKEKPFKCPTCSAAFGRLEALKSHMKTVHDGIKIIKPKNSKCPECDYKCNGEAKLQRHLRAHSAQKLPFSCTIADCDFRTKYNKTLNNHAQKVHNISGRLHECTEPGCNFKTSFLGNLSRHLKAHSNEKPFTCKFPGCNYACKAKFNLDCHTDTVHTNENLLTCSVCDYRTVYKARLRRHEDEQHENIKRFRCQVSKCSFATNSNYYLQHHFDRKHAKKDVVCTEPGCDFSCGTLKLLKRHVKKHVSPILKCPCDFCNFSTRLLRVLRLHISRKHKDVQAMSPLLLVPVKTEVPTVEQARAVDQLSCTFPKCEYQTEFQHRYDLHVKTHHDEDRPFQCPLCFKHFQNMSHLQDHCFAHSKETPFACGHCEYGSSFRSRVKTHVASVHPDIKFPFIVHLLNDRECLDCKVTLPVAEFLAHCKGHVKL